MVNMTKEQRERHHKAIMQQVWGSWGWMVANRVNDLDLLLREVYRDLTGTGVPRATWQPFMEKKVADLMSDYAKDKRAASRGRRKAGEQV